VEERSDVASLEKKEEIHFIHEEKEVRKNFSDQWEKDKRGKKRNLGTGRGED